MIHNNNNNNNQGVFLELLVAAKNQHIGRTIQHIPCVVKFKNLHRVMLHKMGMECAEWDRKELNCIALGMEVTFERKHSLAQTHTPKYEATAHLFFWGTLFSRKHLKKFNIKNKDTSCLMESSTELLVRTGEEGLRSLLSSHGFGEDWNKQKHWHNSLVFFFLISHFPRCIQIWNSFFFFFWSPLVFE